MVAPQAIGYLYPWDVLGDPAAPAWLGTAGVDRVALAAAYHSVRAGTPRHPDRRVVDARTAALYVPAGAAFADQALVPASAKGWTGTANSFAGAAAVVRGLGLPVDAWTVLTHSSAAGGNNPDLCVRNAFGEVYRYALCPSQPQVRTYAAALVAQVLAEGQPDGLVLEAIGPLGFGHQNQHEKTEGAEYSPRVQALLSLCFCTACIAACEARGLPVQEYRSQVRSAVLLAEDHTETPETAPGAADFLPLLDIRWDAAAALLDECLAAIDASGAAPRISLHASPDPWSTGPFVATASLRRSKLWPLMDQVTAVVACWGESDQGVAAVRALKAAAPQARVGAYVLALPPKRADAGHLAAEWESLAEAGADELHVYHLGLASTRRLGAIGGAVTMLRDDGALRQRDVR
ncbi:hypothetical protein SAMN04489743_2504 [Pseudarthrobacter equi]|uniref:Uncharacterized protein n=1 Tax=Pseudarthrobacter equi TaxID=728066 RepID=A0A1H1ZLG4_9MICC|nr:hypothetical protein [Pseudarthrobacter equi]SDT34282.1 hypothetical protein SAMN04489743_2504 [Pseudarthrobacter equi]